MLQFNIEKLSSQIQHQSVRQGQSRYLLGIGATLLLSGTVLLLGKVDVYPAWLMAAGVVSWLIGWRRSS
jgi:ubiquinone biosynthesis protein